MLTLLTDPLSPSPSPAWGEGRNGLPRLMDPLSRDPSPIRGKATKAGRGTS